MAEPPAIFGDDGPPRSRRYGDVYFSRGDGLAETRAVFLTGCGLPERWSGRRRFAVGELGFGTGLNILALLQLWQAERPPGAHLSIFSVEAEPLTADDAARAHAAWPELADISALLRGRWPGQRAGFHRASLPELGATLDVAVMDAARALADWEGRADAWFLDGFAPAVNPAMWTHDLMRLVAERSAPGARAATYTIAGQARRALADAGFEIARRPGFGAKRERLEAALPSGPARDAAPLRVAIIGAGVAGAALARAFADLGVAPRVFEAAAPGAGASGNPAALVTPRLDAGLGPPAQLHAQAFAHAVRLYTEMDGAIVARGAVQFESGPRDAARFAKIAASDLFEPESLGQVTAELASAELGEPAPPALRLSGAQVIEPAAVLGAWLTAVETAAVARLDRVGDVWRLAGQDGAALAEAEVVCLATGAELPRLWPAAPVQPVRGQLSLARGVDAPAVAWGAYVAPMRGGAIFGATNDRDDSETDLRPADDARNLAAVEAQLPRLAAQLRAGLSGARASVRATTPDRLPIAGKIETGLFVLGGLGARGFTLAPLLAEHVAALALGAPSPLPASLAPIIAPARFAERARRRGLVAPPAL